MESLRILVVAASPGLAQELLLAFRRRAAVKVFGPVDGEIEAAQALGSGSIDVAVVELRQGGADAGATIREIATTTPVLVAGDPDPSGLLDALSWGCLGTLPVSEDPAVLYSALRRAAKGEFVFTEDLFSRAFTASASTHSGSVLGTLTGRELEVLRSVADGCSTPEVAANLGISEATVQTHVKSTLAKLGVHSKMEAVRMAWREGVARVPISA